MAVDNLPEDWRVFDDAEQLAQKVTLEILAEAKKAIAERGAFHFITAGGTTPNRCYELLSEAKTDWTKWHIYMGDERVLHFNDSERNSQALLKHWLNNNDIPVKNIHFINTEAGAEKSAKQYACLFDSVVEFDLCLLGMGEDGHTASLFPGHNESDNIQTICCEEVCENDFVSAPIIIENNSPKAPPQRVSLNYVAFSKSRLLIKLVTGANKQEAVSQWLHDNKPLPISLVNGKQTKVYLEQAAIG